MQVETNAGTIAARLDHLRLRNLAPSTLRVNGDALRRLARFLDPLLLLQASSDDLTQWALQLVRLAPRSRYAELSRIHCFYAWAAEYGYITDIPTKRLPRPKVPRSLPRPISEQLLCEALLGAPADIYAYLTLAAFEGLRCVEIASLNRESVLLDREPPIIVVTGKGSKERILPLHPSAAAALRLYGLPNRGPVFRRRDGQFGQPTAQAVSLLCNRWLHSQGIPDSMHSLRHRAITAVYERSSDIRVTQEFAGHSSPQTTAGYAAYSPERLTAAVLGIPQVSPSIVAYGAAL